MSGSGRLTRKFYTRDVLEVAPDLIGRELVLAHTDGSYSRHVITETEAYRGEEDRACHAFRGRTPRTEIMYHHGGMVYVYFVYGMYWMLNIVTGNRDIPQAVLIRGVEGITGPGRLTRSLGIEGSYYGEDLTDSARIWLSEKKKELKYITSPRIGIDYAGMPWKELPWRFLAHPGLI